MIGRDEPREQTEKEPKAQADQGREEAKSASYPDIADHQHREGRKGHAEFQGRRECFFARSEDQVQADHANPRPDQEHGEAGDLHGEDRSQAADDEGKEDHRKAADREHAKAAAQAAAGKRKGQEGKNRGRALDREKDARPDTERPPGLQKQGESGVDQAAGGERQELLVIQPQLAPDQRRDCQKGPEKSDLLQGQAQREARRRHLIGPIDDAIGTTHGFSALPS